MRYICPKCRRELSALQLCPWCARVAAPLDSDTLESLRAERDAAVRRAKKAEAYRDEILASAEQAKRERDQYRRQAVVANMPLDGVWMWGGMREELQDGDVTLVCPVVMEAETLRGLLAERDAARAECERLRRVADLARALLERSDADAGLGLLRFATEEWSERVQYLRSSLAGLSAPQPIPYSALCHHQTRPDCAGCPDDATCEASGRAPRGTP